MKPCDVVARSEVTKQSSSVPRASGLLRFARNDDRPPYAAAFFRSKLRSAACSGVTDLSRGRILRPNT
ncbi:hypothetical protein D1920_07455 [Rhodopseudomonas palustris]|nr:hypothetical protein D1920_07455 [Rhodopseudomonas palustris]